MDYKKMWMDRKNDLLGIIMIGEAEENRKLAPGESRNYDLTRAKDKAMFNLVEMEKVEVRQYYDEHKCLVGSADLLDEIRALSEENRQLKERDITVCECLDDGR